MNLLTFVVLLAAVTVIALIVYSKISKKVNPIAERVEVETEKSNLFSRKGFKLISYEEALEASKQFIYNITKAIMQRFTPDAKIQLSEAGRKLLKAGVQYIHVVDIFSLSMQKEQLNIEKSKEQKIQKTGMQK